MNVLRVRGLIRKFEELQHRVRLNHIDEMSEEELRVNLSIAFEVCGDPLGDHVLWKPFSKRQREAANEEYAKWLATPRLVK